MNDLLWYVLGYVDGRDRSGQRGSRCCCALGATLLVLLAAGAAFLARR